MRLDLHELSKLKLPYILHWGLNHFVVLAKAGKSKATILDPAVGERKLTYKEVSDHFTPRFKARVSWENRARWRAIRMRIESFMGVDQVVEPRSQTKRTDSLKQLTLSRQEY